MWFITAHHNYLIQLEFLEFKTEVKYDTFSAGNGHNHVNISSVILKGISGTEAPRIIVSNDNLMWIRFTTDGKVADKGFQLLVTQLNETGKSYLVYLFRQCTLLVKFQFI